MRRIVLRVQLANRVDLILLQKQLFALMLPFFGHNGNEVVDIPEDAAVQA
jgi:hypothetical protein